MRGNTQCDKEPVFEKKVSVVIIVLLAAEPWISIQMILGLHSFISLFLFK